MYIGMYVCIHPSVRPYIEIYMYVCMYVYVSVSVCQCNVCTAKVIAKWSNCPLDARFFVVVFLQNVNDKTVMTIEPLEGVEGRKEGNVLFYDALNTFYFTVIWRR